MNTTENTDGRTYAYCNMTPSDVRPFDAEILEAIRNGGKLPESLSDLFYLERAPVLNADGSPRWMLRPL